MIIGQIKNGIVLDHITAGMGMELYNKLGLGSLACQVALIKNAESKKMGRKDIIKIDEAIDIDLDALGYIDESITVNIIKDGKLFKRKHLEVPERVVNILKCKNPGASPPPSRSCLTFLSLPTGRKRFIAASTAKARETDCNLVLFVIYWKKINV